MRPGLSPRGMSHGNAWFSSDWESAWEQELIWILLNTESLAWIPCLSLGSCGSWDYLLDFCESQFPSLSNVTQLVRITKDKMQVKKGRHLSCSPFRCGYWSLTTTETRGRSVPWMCRSAQLLISHFRFLLSKPIRLIFCNWYVFFFLPNATNLFLSESFNHVSWLAQARF